MPHPVAIARVRALVDSISALPNASGRLSDFTHARNDEMIALGVRPKSFRELFFVAFNHSPPLTQRIFLRCVSRRAAHEWYVKCQHAQEF